MNIALCYESVLPARGGAETYIADLARRLVRDGHAVHLYASRWDAAALPAVVTFHRIDSPKGLRFLRPWRFGRAVLAELAKHRHDVSVGFDKTWGQDVLYPQGGLHAASQEHNLRKSRGGFGRWLARLGKWCAPAYWSFRALERKQYLGPKPPLVVVNSRMVQGHFLQHYGIPADRLRVVHSAIDPDRFIAANRAELRAKERAAWGIGDAEPVGLFVAMNYRLKGLDPLLRGLAAMPKDSPLKISIVGHPKFGKYRRRAVANGLKDRAIFLGHRSDPKSAYFAADFLVHPTFYDPCSLVVLEALACGLPVITTRFNGASELMDAPASGVVLDDPHDSAAMAKALSAMGDPLSRAAMSQAARTAAEKWTFEMHYRALLAVFTDAAAGRLG